MGTSVAAKPEAHVPTCEAFALLHRAKNPKASRLLLHGIIAADQDQEDLSVFVRESGK